LIMSVLDMFFSTKSRFAPRPARTLPSAAQIRELRAMDRTTCLELYRANEAPFPAGFEREFEKFLDNPDYLKLACYLDEKPIAIGGITRVPVLRWHDAWLVFGMVRPDFHGRGIGTAILLARLAALPRPSKPLRVLLSNIATSEAFLERFGFAHQGQMPGRPGGPFLDVMAAMLDADAWEECRGWLERLGTTPDSLPAVPIVDLHRISTDNSAS
jgi:predicted N-acetyltransferase YhbS